MQGKMLPYSSLITYIYNELGSLGLLRYFFLLFFCLLACFNSFSFIIISVLLY